MSIESDARYEFGFLVTDICNRKNVSQVELAAHARLTRRQVDHVQIGKSGPTRAEIVRIIRSLPAKKEDKLQLFYLLYLFRPRKQPQKSAICYQAFRLQLKYR